MRIGTDVSIQTCRAEGYMVIDYPVHAFRKDPLYTDCRFTDSYPDYARLHYVGEPIIRTDIKLNYKDLWEKYIDNKKGIDSMIGDAHWFKEVPEPYDLLLLASDINSYCGLE
jgi:hypothetical protein